MIASGFAAGTSGGKSVEEYLTKEEGREVAPEIFKGDLQIACDLINTNHRRWKYTSGVLAFHQDDNPTQSQLEEIVQDFEDFMFAGKQPDTFNVAWVLHRDKGNTELHFVVPRVDLETGQDLNIAPPVTRRTGPHGWPRSITDMASKIPLRSHQSSRKASIGKLLIAKQRGKKSTSGSKSRLPMA